MRERERVNRGERELTGERERGERERVNRRERERSREREGEIQGVVAPLAHTQRPPLGALGLAAGQAAAPGGAGRRRGSGAGHSPGEGRKRRGGCCPLNREKERGLAPLTARAQGAQVGPLVAHGRRRTAGGAPNWGGTGHPKGRRRGLLPPPQQRTGGQVAPWPRPKPPAHRRRRSAPAGGAGGERRRSGEGGSWPDPREGRERK